MRKRITTLFLIECAFMGFMTTSCSDEAEDINPQSTTPTTVTTKLGQYPVFTQVAFDSLIAGQGWASYDYWEIDKDADTIVAHDFINEFEKNNISFDTPPTTIYDVMMGESPRKILFATTHATELYYLDSSPRNSFSEEKTYTYNPSSNTIKLGDGQDGNTIVVLSVEGDTLKTITFHGIGGEGSYCYEIFTRVSEETVQTWLNEYPKRQE